MPKRAAYPSDLTDAEWSLLEAQLPPARKDVRPRKHPMREIINAIRSWRMLPHDFPPYRVVFYYFSLWRKTSVWEKIHDALYAQLRTEMGREAQASAGSLDSQSVKTTEKGG